MILLPEKPMRRRYFDARVGWFSRGQTDYGLDVQKSKTVRYLDRWRLEVKDEDLEKFKRGELVEPKKPIVYYIDRATLDTSEKSKPFFAWDDFEPAPLVEDHVPERRLLSAPKF